MTVSLPADLHSALRRAADEEQRSISSEIVVRLRRALAGGDGGPVGVLVNGDGPSGGVVPGAVLRAAPAVSGRARTVMCEHRIPAAGFCKVCDGG